MEMVLGLTADARMELQPRLALPGEVEPAFQRFKPKQRFGAVADAEVAPHRPRAALATPVAYAHGGRDQDEFAREPERARCRDHYEAQRCR